MGGGNRKKKKTKKTTTIRKIDAKQFDNRRETTTTTNNRNLTTKQQLQNKVQQRFRDREAKGLDGLTGMRKVTAAERKQGVTQLTQYRAAQKEQVRNSAIARNAANVTGIPSGDNLKAGSFGISEAGKAQAAANLAARTAPEGAFGISEAGRKQAAAQLQEKRTYDKAFSNLQARDPGMAKYISSLPANIRTDALIGGQTRAAGVELGIGLGTLALGKAALGSLGIGAASKGLGYKGAQVGFTGMGKTGFDAISKGAKYIASNKPQILGKGAYSAPTYKGAMRYAGTQGSLGGAQTPGGVIKSIVSGKAPRIGFLESQAKVSPGMFDKGAQLANKISQGAYGKSALANTFRNQMSTGIAPGGGFGTGAGNVFTAAGLGAAGTAAVKSGGLNIGGSSAEASEGETTSGSGIGRAIGNAAKVAARFNPLSAIDFATNDRTDLDRMGNLTIAGREIKPYNLASDAAMIGNKVRQGDLSIGDVREGVSDFTNTAKADNRAEAFFKNYDADDFMKSLDVANESKIVQNQLEKEGFPSDFKKQVGDTFEGLKEEASKIEQGKVNNRLLMKNRVDEINNLLANVNENPKLSTLSRVAGQFDPATNPNADNMETMDKIKAGFDPSSPNVKALSATDRGIKGSAGNLLIGGKMSDIYRQATGDIEGGVNAGIPKGQVGLSNADMFNVASSAYRNITTPETLSARQADSIQRTISGGVTAGSLIRGSLPNFGGRTGSSGSTTTPRGTGTTAPAAAVEELLIPQTPTYTTPTQTGTDTSNLQQIQQQSYMQNLAQLGITNLMQLPQFRTQQQPAPRRFRSFRRDYF